MDDVFLSPLDSFLVSGPMERWVLDPHARRAAMSRIERQPQMGANTLNLF